MTPSIWGPDAAGKTPLQKYLRRDLDWRGHEYDTVLRGRVTNFFGVASREDIEYVFESRKQYATTGDPECVVSGGSSGSRNTAPEKTPENAWERLDYLSWWVAEVVPEAEDEAGARPHRIFVFAVEAMGQEVGAIPFGAFFDSAYEDSSSLFGLKHVHYRDVMDSLEGFLIWTWPLKDMEQLPSMALTKYAEFPGLPPVLGEPITAAVFPPDAQYYVMTDIAYSPGSERGMLNRLENWEREKQRMQGQLQSLRNDMEQDADRTRMLDKYGAEKNREFYRIYRDRHQMDIRDFEDILDDGGTNCPLRRAVPAAGGAPVP